MRLYAALCTLLAIGMVPPHAPTIYTSLYINHIIYYINPVHMYKHTTVHLYRIHDLSKLPFIHAANDNAVCQLQTHILVINTKHIHVICNISECVFVLSVYFIRPIKRPCPYKRPPPPSVNFVDGDIRLHLEN
jgi:hypothetical protein